PVELAANDVPAPADLPPAPEDLPPAPQDLPPAPEDVAAPAPADLPPAPADLPPAPEDLAPPVDVHEASTVAYTKKLWQAIVGQNISGNDALDALAQPAVFA
ncbi:resuscitation-promoting factor RpfA, partial [Mycobacterium ulcerans]